MSTGQAGQQRSEERRKRPTGWYPLLAFDLVGAAGCGCVSLQSVRSPDAGGLSLSAGLCAVTATMFLAGVCLLVRRPWGWGVAAGAQLLAGITQLMLASIGLSLTETARAKGGDWSGFAILAGFIIFLPAALSAASSLAGYFHLRRPGVRALFKMARPSDEN